jgi:DNA-binding transcriptional ArsR family regulator
MVSAQSKAPEATPGAIAAHPLRSRCLTVLAERTTSPVEIAEGLGEHVSNVSYHVRKLREAGAVELVSERRVRGAVEHFYRAVMNPPLSDEECADLSLPARLESARQILSLATADATSALESTTLGARPDHHLSRIPLRVDEQGWEELREVYGEALRRVLEIRDQSAERLSRERDAASIPVTAFHAFFEMPDA